MNVVQREKPFTSTAQKDTRNEFIRRDSSTGIRGALPTFKSFNSTRSSSKLVSNGPRYNFTSNVSRKKTTPMGPPLEPPKSLKRKYPATTSSTSKLESSSSKTHIRVLASDSAPDTSVDFCTPKNRPNALRYISSSSRGGYSGNRSGRSTSTSAVEASVVLAIAEGRGMARGEIGMAAIDLRHPNLVLCQFSDTLLYTHTLTKIHYFNPVEIIVPHTFCEGVQPSQLYKLIKDQFPMLNLTTVQRRHYNDAVGRQQIQSLVAPAYSAVYLQVHNKFYALTAAAAVLKYVEYIQCLVFARESLKILYHSSENTMILDVGTATQLELVQPLIPSAGATCCLLGVLGPTYTIGGIRALRAAILQPSCNAAFIEARLDAVQDLIENDHGLMMGLQDVIKKLSEIDKILFLCVETPNQSIEKMGEAQLNQTLLLKTTMDLVPSLVEALQCAEADRLRKIKMDLENPHFKEISVRIHNILQEDAHLERGAMGSLQRCFAVKPDINGLLDVARRTYSELIEDIQKIVEQLSETYDLPIRLSQNMLKGFHIIMPVAPRNRRDFQVDKLPDVFIQVQNNGASVTMTTEELVVLDQQAKESLKEIQKMSNIVIGGLLKELRPFMSSLYKLCEDVAEMDILIALAQASTTGSYIRPQFSDYLDVRNSVHPLLDYNSHTLPVPNDIYACEEHNFTIITGPNMGGKSIYIKQVALMQIMAQIGCFVSATKATFRLCDRIFSRIGFNDSVELNASTFVLEMKEIQHILQGLTATSVVIIDELCRGTNSEEGTGIAWAICEELIASEAYTFFTTHFMYLTRLEEMYCNVVNLYTLVSEQPIPSTPNTSAQQKRLQYEHKLTQGVTTIQQYGLALAARTHLPVETVNLAVELAELIARGRRPNEVKSPERRDERLLYELNAKIRMEARKSDEPELIAKSMMLQFKEEHPDIVARLRKEKITKDLTESIAKESSKDYESDSSVKIYTTPDHIVEDNLEISHRERNDTTERDKHTNVKSSNELLNTIMTNGFLDETRVSQHVEEAAAENNEGSKPVLAVESSTDESAKAKRKQKFKPPIRVSDSDSSKLIEKSFIQKTQQNQNDKSFDERRTPIVDLSSPPRKRISNASNSNLTPQSNSVSSLDKSLQWTRIEAIPDTSQSTDFFDVDLSNKPKQRKYTEYLRTPSVTPTRQIQPESPETIEIMEEAVDIHNNSNEDLPRINMLDVSKKFNKTIEDDVFKVNNKNITNGESIIFKEILQDIKVSDEIDNLDKDLINTNSMLIEKYKNNETDEKINTYNEQNIDNVIFNNTDTDPTKLLNLSQASTLIIEESDVDMAEAPTQVIVDVNLNSDVSSSSVDEELMRETIEEIGQDIESIVLTPPEGFRD